MIVIIVRELRTWREVFLDRDSRDVCVCDTGSMIGFLYSFEKSTRAKNEE